MSNDLISRKALIHQISSKYDTQYRAYSFNLMVDDVQKQPTAYDVDKVIEQLQNAGSRISFYDERISLNEAIEIVRKGGIE